MNYFQEINLKVSSDTKVYEASGNLRSREIRESHFSLSEKATSLAGVSKIVQMKPTKMGRNAQQLLSQRDNTNMVLR